MERNDRVRDALRLVFVDHKVSIFGGVTMWLNAGDEQILINLDQVRQIGTEGTSLVLVFAAGEKLRIRSFASENEAKNALRHISHEIMTTDLPPVRSP